MSTTISGTNGVTFPDSTSMQTGQQACKAWVNFNGTGTVAIRAGYNVSSISDNGTGDYTVNFTTAMPDSNYAVNGTCSMQGVDYLSKTVCTLDNSPPTSSGCRIRTMVDGSIASEDRPFVYVTIFR